MKTKQVTQRSGNVYHFNLDGLTCEEMEKALAYHNDNDCPVSLSVLIRRAIRVYAEHVEELTDAESKVREAYELLKAGRGL